MALPLCGLLVVLWLSSAMAAPVALERARRVAQNTLRRHVALFGDWNGMREPEVGQGQAVVFRDSRVAYNFPVQPSGHVLVAVDDLISPVLLYSTRSAFDPSRAGRPQALESWIIPEAHRHVQAVRNSTSGAGVRASAASGPNRIAAAWSHYGQAVDAAARSAQAEDSRSITRGAVTMGPLLTTAWGQDDPYNLQTPNDGCVNGHTLTGCVATAWAQLMRYWRWPVAGTGSPSYIWTDSSDDNHTLTVDLDAAEPYDWDNMPDTMEGSNAAQQEAVSLLIYHVGVTAQMQYGCETSGSSAWADEVLDIYFGYRDSMTYYGPADLIDTEPFPLLKAELDADPPRPAILSIFSTDVEPLGHEVVVDGYQTSDTEDLVHINFGWESSYDGYYNLSVNFETGSWAWDAEGHNLVIGIQPNNDPPVINAGSDQNVSEAAQVQLTGSATDPEGVGLTYRWTQTSGPTAVLSNETTLTPTFTAPSVSAQTALVFELRVDDLNRAWTADTVTVNVANTDGGGGGGGGGGGCFITLLQSDF